MHKFKVFLASFLALAMVNPGPVIAQSSGGNLVSQRPEIDPEVPVIVAPKSRETVTREEMDLAKARGGFQLQGYICGVEADFHALAREIVDLQRAASAYGLLKQTTDQAIDAYEDLARKVAQNPSVDAAPLSRSPQDVFDGLVNLLGTGGVFGGGFVSSRSRSVEAPDALQRIWKEGPLNRAIPDRLNRLNVAGVERYLGRTVSAPGGGEAVTFEIDDCYTEQQVRAALSAHDQAAQVTKRAFDDLQASRAGLNLVLGVSPN